MTAPSTAPQATAESLVERLFEATLGLQDLLSIYLGDQLGYYRELATLGPLTSAELASRAGANERYTREWLEQQATTGFLEVDDPGAPAANRRFSLPETYLPVFCDPDSPFHFAPIGRGIVGLVTRVPDVAEAYRTGGGVTWESFGADLREAQAGLNRPLFLGALVNDYFPSLPAIHERLSRSGAQVADFGCGGGWSSIGIARAYPGARVDGFDIDLPSIELATRNAGESGVDGRVRFSAGPAAEGVYDLVTAFECIHDMSDPVSVLAAMRRAAKPDGVVVVMDERVGERFDPAAHDPVERFMYGWSITCCLPCGMAGSPSAQTGTVMRPGTLEAYAKEAGFNGIEVLPVEDYFFRFYRLV